MRFVDSGGVLGHNHVKPNSVELKLEIVLRFSVGCNNIQ